MPPVRKTKRREVDTGSRAVIACHKELRVPLKDVTNLTEVPRGTAIGIRQHAEDSQRRTKLPLSHELNNTPYIRTGRPSALTKADIDALILHATLNKVQRAKPWPIIADELGIECSRWVVARAFKSRGYKRCKATHKPYLSPEMKQRRYDWASERRFWTVNRREKNDWRNVYFTDETPIPLGIQDQIHDVTRLPSEKWEEDCCVNEFKKPMKLQFFGGIAYNWKGPCYIFHTETAGQKEASIDALNDAAREKWKRLMEAFGVRAQNYLMAKAMQQHSQYKKIKSGRWPKVPFIKDAGPQRSKGGGIDWYRFVNEVLEPTLLLDWVRLRESRPDLQLILDGAAAHNSANCSPLYERWEIDRLNWPGNSPDLNPIEHIWDLMKQRIKKKYGIIRTIDELKRIWYEEWDLLSIQDINNVIDNQRKAVLRAYNAQGGNRFHG